MLQLFVNDYPDMIQRKNRIKICVILNFPVMPNIAGLASLDCLYCCLAFVHVDGVIHLVFVESKV